MRTWNVYDEEGFLGTVQAETLADAEELAIHRYGLFKVVTAQV